MARASALCTPGRGWCCCGSGAARGARRARLRLRALSSAKPFHALICMRCPSQPDRWQQPVQLLCGPAWCRQAHAYRTHARVRAQVQARPSRAESDSVAAAGGLACTSSSSNDATTAPATGALRAHPQPASMHACCADGLRVCTHTRDTAWLPPIHHPCASVHASHASCWHNGHWPGRPRCNR